MVNIPPGVADALKKQKPAPTRTLDQGFAAFGAKLVSSAGPYDPRTKTGDSDDYARFVARPGVDFKRPWLAVQNGIAFQWPLGLEGFTLTNDPKTSTHSFLGDNGVRVDVLNLSEEHIVLSGNFVGNSSPAMIQALRQVVLADPGKAGSKILYVPEILPHAVRCQVARSEFSRNDTDRGRDASYSIELIFVGSPLSNVDPVTIEKKPTTAASKGVGTRTISANSKYNTLRKIAAWKLGSANNWRQLYNANETWFSKRKIALAKAPDYRLPIGTTLYY